VNSEWHYLKIWETICISKKVVHIVTIRLKLDGDKSTTLMPANKVRIYSSPFPRGPATSDGGLNRASLA